MRLTQLIFCNGLSKEYEIFWVGRGAVRAWETALMKQGSSRPSTPLEYFLFFTQPIAKDGRCWFWLCEAQSLFN